MIDSRFYYNQYIHFRQEKCRVFKIYTVEEEEKDPFFVCNDVDATGRSLERQINFVRTIFLIKIFINLCFQ